MPVNHLEAVPAHAKLDRWWRFFTCFINTARLHVVNALNTSLECLHDFHASRMPEIHSFISLRVKLDFTFSTTLGEKNNGVKNQSVVQTELSASHTHARTHTNTRTRDHACMHKRDNDTHATHRHT